MTLELRGVHAKAAPSFLYMQPIGSAVKDQLRVRDTITDHLATSEFQSFYILEKLHSLKELGQNQHYTEDELYTRGRIHDIGAFIAFRAR